MKNKKQIKSSEGLKASEAKYNPLSRFEKIFFRIIMILLPFAILFLLEASLRLLKYGDNTDLFVLRKTNTTEEYVLNKDFTKRYFSQKGISTPIPVLQSFSAEKSSSTYRIFCLGESTVQGFPYPPNAAFPAMLKNILTTLHPERNIDVINCGITAIMSYSVVDMAEEILKKYKPDLIIVYTGHNEFYGVFGQASRLTLFENRTMMRFYLKLQKLKVFLLLRNLLNGIFQKDISNDTDLRRGTMMGIVAKDVGLKLNDPVIKRVEEIYRDNIQEIISCAKEYNTPLMICSLVSNKRDFFPFSSKHCNDFAKKDTALWNDLFVRARSFQNSNEYRQTVELFSQTLAIDSFYAEIHFRLGECYYKLQDYRNAGKHFTRASDLDVIRFRAPSSFNKIIRQLCAENKVPLIDLEKEFENISTGGIVGSDLLFEHVHPNQKGYLLIAESISKAMSENKLISSSWDWSKNLSDSAFCIMSQISRLDHETVNQMLARLIKHWPFNDNHKSLLPKIGNGRIEQLASSFVESGEGSLVELHVKYGRELQDNNQIDAAISEYKAALAINPLSEIYNLLGCLYLKKTEVLLKEKMNPSIAEQAFTEGVKVFNEGLVQSPDDIELNFNSGLLYSLRADKLNEAKARFQKTLELEPSHQKSQMLLSRINSYLKLNKL